MGCITFSLDLHESQIAPFIKKGLLQMKKNPEMPVMDFVNTIADSIKAAAVYELESLEEILQLSEALKKTVAGSKLITPAVKEKILKEYENHLFKAFSLNTDTIPENDTDLILKNMPEDIDNESETSEPKVLDHRIDKLYGSAIRIKDYMLRQFRNGIVEASLVSFKDRRRIKSVRDLNQAIAKYKNLLFKSLFDYIKAELEEDGLTWDNSLLDYIYNEDGIPNVENMQKVLELADKVLYDLDRDMLNSAFSSKYSLANEGKNLKLINAFNSYVLLTNGNFDKVLSSILGKDFVIKKIYAGRETDVNNEKYKFQGATNYRKSWNDSNVDAVKEMGGVSRIFIETTPLLDHRTGLAREDRYLDPKTFFSTFNKLMDLESVRKFPTEIKDLATSIQGNADYAVQLILKYVCDPLFNNQTFSTGDMDIFRSVYERFYNPDRPDSLYSILRADYESSPVILSYDLLEVISGLIFRTNSARFTQYKYDKDTQDMVALEIMQSNALGKRLKVESGIESFTKNRSDRKDLLDKYNVQIVNSTTGELSFDLTFPNRVLRFSYNPTALKNQKLKAYEVINGKPELVALANIMQEPSFTDMKDYYERGGLSTKDLASPKQQVYVELVKYIDAMLDLGFLNGNLDLLEQFKGLFGIDNTAYLTEHLLKLAQSAALANYVYNEYENTPDRPDNIGEFMKTLDVYANIDKDDVWKTRYNSKTNKIKIAYPGTLDVIERIANALRAISGEMYKTVVKNADGNNIAVNRMANLANQTRYYLTTRVINNERSTIKDNLFANNLDNIYGVTIREDAVSKNNIRKSATKFTEAEHGYSSIVLDFYGKLISKEENKNKKLKGVQTEEEDTNKAKYVLIQPTVYSDKTAFYAWKVGTVYKIGNTVLNLETATPKQLNDAIKATVGNQYKKTYLAVFNNYRSVLKEIILPEDYIMGGFNFNLEFVDNIARMIKVLKASSNESELARGKNVEKAYNKLLKVYDKFVEDLEAYRQKREKIDEKNNELATKNAEYLRTGQLNRVKTLLPYPAFPKFMENMTDNEIVALLSVTPMDMYNDTSYYLGLHSISNLHVTPLKFGGGTFVKPNNLLRYNATKLYADDAIYDAQMLREKKRFVKDLITFNITFPLVYSDGKENYVLKEAIKQYGGPAFTNNWVNAGTLELILAKLDGKPINIFNPIADIRDGKPIELNPLLERYFLSDVLVSGNLKIATSGFEIAHPNKSSAGEELNMANAELEEASRAGGLYKRNVIITATKLGYIQNSIVGVTPTMRVAVMQDVQARVYNVNGVTGKVDAHDGSADNNMLWHILENLSLGEAATGEDAKPIAHDFTDFGTARLFKYATFGQYNERLRKSQTSPINQYAQFKRLNDEHWNATIPARYKNRTDDWHIQLGKNIYGRDFTLQDIMDGDRLFFRRGNRHYEIISLDNVGIDTYARTIREVDANGNYIGLTVQEAPVEINTNYALHKALGGVYSESLRGGKVKSLAYTDASLYATVRYINNTGHFMGKPGEKPSLLNTYLPLKYAMVACMINGSAMKVGAEYTNPTEAWYNTDITLKTIEMATDGIGTQMDADHIVTDPEHQSTMTEFSQVISALEANGTTHDISKQAYKDLGKVAVAAMADVEQAIKDFLESDFSPEGKSKIYEIVGQMIVRELTKDGKNLGLSQSIVAKVKEEFAKKRKNQADADFHMPFSDPSIFNKALATFTSTINKTAIKRKFPGMGAVMAPAYDKTMNFNINGLDMSYDDIYKEAADKGFFGSLATINEFNLSGIDYSKVDIEEVDKPWKSDPNNINKTIRIYLKDLHDKGYFELVKDFESKYYSAHFKTGDANTGQTFGSTSEERATLYEQLRNAIPDGAYVSTWGEVSQGGLKALDKVGRGYTVTGERQVKDRNGNDINIPVYQKREGEVNVLDYLDNLQYELEHSVDENGKLINLLTSDKILPNDIVRVTDKNGNVIKEIDIKTMDDYREAKSYSHYFKVINKPSNLKPMDIHWTVNRVLYNLYDLPQVQYAFSERPKYDKKNPIPRLLDLSILKGIDNALALLDKGFMSVIDPNTGQYVEIPIDEGSLVNNPAEIILSKIYAEQFGLLPSDTLYDVLSQGSAFFEKRYAAYHTPKTHNYDICFTRADGRHMYLAYNDSGIKKNLAANKIDDAELYVRDGMNLYRVDEDGNKLYRAGAYDENDKLTMLVESYSTTDSDEIIEVLVVKNNELILELYDSHEYDSIIINRNAEPLADRIVELVLKGAEEGQGDFVLMERLLTNQTEDGKRVSLKFEDYVARLKKLRKSQMEALSKKRFVSFLKSLEYTVARIPAQTLQSFMKMKAVLFADSDKNVVYVTHWLTWLQGSDYRHT